MPKAWEGRFTGKPDVRAEAFTSSLAFDRRLAVQDVTGSIAHARMLARSGVIGRQEGELIVAGLERIREELADGTFPFRREAEDIHLNIEKRLVELIGPVGGKLHTARSRNDQVALDLHLYLRETTDEVREAIRRLQRALFRRAAEELESGTILPGYTHLQQAQPVLLAHHLLAYFWMLDRDWERFRQVDDSCDRSPLGAAALAGTSFPVDPVWTAGELGFSRLYENSVDAVSDRDFACEFLFGCALLGAHLSRLAEELVIWSTREFGFIRFADAYATGSSIMPQKKNPDTAELVRGKTGRLYGNLLGLLTVLKGLPLAYGSDLQEDKEKVFDSADTVLACLDVAEGICSTLEFRRERMREMVDETSLVTDLADHLASKGVPFREAHAMVGKLVRWCEEEGRRLSSLTTAELGEFSIHLDQEAVALLDPAAVVARRRSPGGTAPGRVAEELTRARKCLMV